MNAILKKFQYVNFVKIDVVHSEFNAFKLTTTASAGNLMKDGVLSLHCHKHLISDASHDFHPDGRKMCEVVSHREIYTRRHFINNSEYFSVKRAENQRFRK